MSTFAELRDVLATTEPRLLDIPSEFPMPEDPIAWAHRVCSAHPSEIRVEAMPRTLGADVEDQRRALSLAPDADPELVRNVLTGIARGTAAHAAMELWHSVSFGERVADPEVLPLKRFFEGLFEARLCEQNPVGHHSKLTLWFSADEHVYDAHCDQADGVLFQLSGEKVVEVWPVPSWRGKRTLFDHAYRFDPIGERGQRFEVTAGKVLFIPAGAMHEVVVGHGQVSVSMSLHAGAPFPLLELCRDLNHLSGGEEVFGLGDEMSRRDKFHVIYFEPAMFRDDEYSARMPDTLREALAEVIVCPQGWSRERLAELLNAWWLRALSTPCYPGPDVPPQEADGTSGIP